MKYNLLLVDDEEMIRNGLSKFIDWDSLGFNLVASLSDGREAIEYIGRNKVDVILTDIKMNYVSGIEVAKYVYENMLHPKVVILSAYDDFNFAREGMKYNVQGYVLKTANNDEISEAMREVYNKLDRACEKDRKYNTNLEWSNEVIPYLKEQLLIDILTGALKDKRDILNRFRLANVNINLEKAKVFLYNIAIANLDEYLDKTWKYGREGFNNAFRNFFSGQKIDEEVEFIYYIVNNNIKLLIITMREPELDLYEDSFAELFNLHIGFELIKKYKNTFYMCSVKKSINKDSMDEQKKNFISLIHEQKTAEAKKVFIAYVQNMQNVDLKDWFKDFVCSNIPFDDINISSNNATKEEIEKRGIELIYRVGNYLTKTDKESVHYLIKNSIEYIHNNICSDITLEEVAGHVFLSSAYFSRLFKEQMGMNFKDYILRNKIEKAKILLQEPQYKIYEISYILGYDCVRFFAKTFKKFSGQTPSEYRRGLPL